MKYALSLALPLFSVLALTSADDGVAAEFEGTGLASFSSSSLRARQDVTIPHFCFQKGATCVTCFGAGYIQCPGDTSHCYNPAKTGSVCPGGSSGSGSGSGSSGSGSGSSGSGSGSSGSGSSGSSSTCADQYGAGSVSCSSTSCYNPTKGDVCCAGGYKCTNGRTCSTRVGYCSSSGSGSSGSGSGSGSGSFTSTDVLFPTATSTDDDLFPSSTSFSSATAGFGDFGGSGSGSGSATSSSGLEATPPPQSSGEGPTVRLGVEMMALGAAIVLGANFV